MLTVIGHNTLGKLNMKWYPNTCGHSTTPLPKKQTELMETTYQSRLRLNRVLMYGGHIPLGVCTRLVIAI